MNRILSTYFVHGIDSDDTLKTMNRHHAKFFSSLEAREIVMIKTFGVASNDKIGIMMIIVFSVSWKLW